MTPVANKILTENHVFKTEHGPGDPAEIHNDAVEADHARRTKEILEDIELLDEAMSEWAAGHPYEYKGYIQLFRTESLLGKASSFNTLCEAAAEEYAALEMVRESE